MTLHLQKAKLLEEIYAGLESDTGSLIPTVRKAARLAQLHGDLEHRVLFDFHLDGLDPTGKTGARLERWPEGAPSPKWDVVKALLADRAVTNDKLEGSSLAEIETRLRMIRQVETGFSSPQETKLSKTKMDAELSLGRVLERIRNRVDVFARKIEREMMSENPAPQMDRKSPSSDPKKVFIGHGRSHLWRDLRDLLADRLALEWDEFNRESTAGLTTKERLETMLQEASFAFLIMTAEDEHADGTHHARENVIHEIGLFQGRLGFKKAIVLLEEGCQEFSNITGLTQIRFPSGDILARSEEIRRVLEREGISSR